jgi:hypothetical protein
MASTLPMSLVEWINVQVGPNTNPVRAALERVVKQKGLAGVLYWVMPV